MNEQIKDGGLMFPVVEFRPLPGFFSGEVRRYADGQWIPDDGEYDLAFICRNGAPTCLMFEHSYQKNIVVRWLDGSWQAREPRHPRGNPWHYALRDGKTEWGGQWGRDSHPNTLAGRHGMDKISSEVRCANGRHVTMRVGDEHIEAGLARYRDTGFPVTIPHGVCMYCGDSSVKAMLAPAPQPGEPQ